MTLGGYQDGIQQSFRGPHRGRLCFDGGKINLSHVFAGQNVGVTQVSDRVWLVTFMQYDLGYFDEKTCRVEPIENPFGARVSSTLATSVASGGVS